MENTINSTNQKEVILDIQNVSKKYKQGTIESVALDNVSLKISDGEIIVILRALRIRKNYTS